MFFKVIVATLQLSLDLINELIHFVLQEYKDLLFGQVDMTFGQAENDLYLPDGQVPLPQCQPLHCQYG